MSSGFSILMSAIFSQSLTLLAPQYFFSDIHWRTYIFVRAFTRLLQLRTFEVAMSKPVKIGRSYIPQKKALLPSV